MVNSKLTLLTLAMIFLVPLISAEITLNVNVQDGFSLNEQMFFSYTLNSDINTSIIFMPHIMCPNAPIGFLQEQTIELQANTPCTEIYQDQLVQDWFEPQTCTAYVQILSPIQKTVSKNFSIVTSSSFDFNLIFSKKVFLQSEEIYLDYESSVEEVIIEAILTYPDKSTEQIDLPISIKASQVGTYELEITASKEGYKDVLVKEQFAVIKEDAKIEQVNFSEEEKKISFEEKFDKKVFDKKINENLFYQILIGFLVLIILLVIRRILIRKRK